MAVADTLPEKDFTALALDEITELRDHAGAKHIAFIFDACFSGQALGLTRSVVTASKRLLEKRLIRCSPPERVTRPSPISDR